jgi:co-chaperonin GroES (HSP10)
MQMPSIRTSVEGKRGCGYRKAGGMYLVCSGEGRTCGKLPMALEPCEQCEALGVKCRLEQSRSWTTVNIDKLFASRECVTERVPAGFEEEIRSLEKCSSCPLQGDMGIGGLLWVGELKGSKHGGYPTPEAFMEEADRMGISKRLPLKSIPKELRDKDGNFRWVLLAHPKTIEGECDRCCSPMPIGVGHDNQLIRQRRPGWVEDADKPGQWATCPDCDGAGKIFGPGIFRVFKPTAVEYVVDEKDDDEKLEALEKRGIELVKVVPHPDTPHVITAPDGREHRRWNKTKGRNVNPIRKYVVVEPKPPTTKTHSGLFLAPPKDDFHDDFRVGTVRGVGGGAVIKKKRNGRVLITGRAEPQVKVGDKVLFMFTPWLTEVDNGVVVEEESILARLEEEDG